MINKCGIMKKNKPFLIGPNNEYFYIAEAQSRDFNSNFYKVEDQIYDSY